MPRAQAKTATLTLRVDPRVKDLLTAAAEADRRSLSNMLEVIVLGYCKRHGIVADKPRFPPKPPVAAKKKRVPA
ncbi:MAG: hypothetical protein ACYC7I_05470 [Gammaproteobacteria bacterium]